MLDTANAHKDRCVGLAAVQIGVHKKVILALIGGAFVPFINPRIIKRSTQTYTTTERCMSLEGEREVRTIADMTATSEVKDLALIASVEIVKSKSHNTLGEFVNEEGSIARGYRLVSKDIFSVTKEAFATPDSAKVGAYVIAKAGRKMDVADAEAEGTTTIGKIIAVEGEWYVIEVA